MEKRMEKNLAPIVLFVYNRSEHTKKTIEALKKNHLAEESELFIYSDGPKRDDDIIKVKEVRRYIHQVDGFKQVHVNEREENYGIEKSIITGVDELISKYGKVIVLEDDLITDINFLSYMNQGLDKYQDNLKVYSITGYSYLQKEIENGEPFFLKICSSWSWGTWIDRWQKYDLSCEGWEKLQVDRHLRKKFNYDNSYPFYNLLKSQFNDCKMKDWDVKWYWTIFKNEGLTLYPPMSLVNNVGFDGSGVHGVKAKIIKNMGDLSVNDIQSEWKFDSDVLEQKKMRKKVAKAIWQQTVYSEKKAIIKDILGLE